MGDPGQGLLLGPASSMNCLPVIEMEMRSVSRRTWTFGLRVIFALTSALTCLVILALPRVTPGEKSRAMLNLLSFMSLAFCLVAGGSVTADCVSSEKRQGTLGLLFLTPLKGIDVVLGKLVCHGLQIFYGMCAVFPVFFLPLLTGGVTWAEVSRIVLALVLSLLLAAAVGMLTSVLGTDSRKTLMATFTSLLLLAAAPMVYWLLRRVFLASGGAAAGPAQVSPIFSVLAGFDWSYRAPNGSKMYWSSLLISASLSLSLILTAGWLIGRVVQVSEARVSSTRTRRAQPVLLGLLEGNPYEWSLLRTGSDTKLVGALAYAMVLFFALMVVLSVSTNHWQEGFITAFFTALAIHLVTKLRFAVEATRQIQNDHQTGALELLLVTDLPDNSVVTGHQAALRRLGRKPLLILISLNLALESCVILFPHQLHMNTDDTAMFTIQFLGGMVLAAADLYALRWLGFLSGLRASSHIRAVMVSFCSVMIVPWIGIGLMIAWLSSVQPKTTSLAFMFCLWVVLSLIYDGLLIRRCRRKLQAGLRRIASEG